MQGSALSGSVKEMTLTDIRTIENRFSPIVLRYIVNVNDSVYGLIYNRHARNCHLTPWNVIAGKENMQTSIIQYNKSLKLISKISSNFKASQESLKNSSRQQ